MPPSSTAALAAAAVLGGASLVAGSLSDVFYLLGFGLVVAVALRGASRAHDRRVWTPIAVALLLWWLGDALYAVLLPLGHADGPVSPSDALWLAGYPLVLAGVLRMVKRRTPWALVECSLDAVVFTAALSLAVWRLVLEPVWEDVGLAELLLRSLYPGGDVLLLGALLLLLLSPGRNGWSGSLMAAAIALTLLGDVLALRLPDGGAPLDAVLLLANVLLAASVAHRDRDLLTENVPSARRSQMHTARAVFLGVALWIPSLVAVLGAGLDASAAVGVVVASTAVCGAASVRFVLSARRREQAEAALYRRATLDQLTGLANRATLQEALDAGAPWAGGGALLYLDLDGFKPVNDQHGHRAGDEVLVTLAARLRARASRDAVTARMGGDEFAVLLLRDPDRAERLAADIVHDLSVPVSLPSVGADVAVGASVGVLRWTGQHSSTSLLHAADTVMYAVKQAGTGWGISSLGDDPSLAAASDAEGGRPSRERHPESGVREDLTTA